MADEVHNHWQKDRARFHESNGNGVRIYVATPAVFCQDGNSLVACARPFIIDNRAGLPYVCARRPGVADGDGGSNWGDVGGKGIKGIGNTAGGTGNLNIRYSLTGGATRYHVDVHHALFNFTRLAAIVVV